MLPNELIRFAADVRTLRKTAKFCKVSAAQEAFLTGNFPRIPQDTPLDYYAERLRVL
jgi:hypothetical protein